MPAARLPPPPPPNQRVCSARVLQFTETDIIYVVHTTRHDPHTLIYQIKTKPISKLRCTKAYIYVGFGCTVEYKHPKITPTYRIERIACIMKPHTYLTWRVFLLSFNYMNCVHYWHLLFNHFESTRSVPWAIHQSQRKMCRMCICKIYLANNLQCINFKRKNLYTLHTNTRHFTLFSSSLTI